MTPPEYDTRKTFLSVRPRCSTLAGVVWDEGDVVRILEPSEQRFVRHGTYTGRSVSVAGRIDAAALRAAFVLLRYEYPILACRIGVDRHGYGHLLRPGAFGVSGVWIGYGDPATVQPPQARLDPAEQLAYLDVVLSRRPRCRVTLYVHHGIADGGHCVALLTRLWDCYTACAESAATPMPPHDYPEPLEWFAARHGIVRGLRSGFDSVARPLPSSAHPSSDMPVESLGTTGQADSDPAPASAPDPGIGSDLPGAERPPANSLARPQRIRLDRASTAQIIEVSRTHRLTVNALLTAALLRAYAIAVAGAGSAPVSLGCLYPVDLRTRLDPPVAAAAGTNMGGMASFATDIDGSVCVLDLARHISDRLRHDLDEGTVQQSVLHFPDFYGAARTRSLAGHIAITNTGVVPALRTPAGLRITDYEIVYLSAHPRPSLGPSAAVTFLAYTFAARLTVALLGCPGQQERLLDTVHAELTAPVRQRGVLVSGFNHG